MIFHVPTARVCVQGLGRGGLRPWRPDHKAPDPSGPSWEVGLHEGGPTSPYWVVPVPTTRRLPASPNSRPGSGVGPRRSQSGQRDHSYFWLSFHDGERILDDSCLDDKNRGRRKKRVLMAWKCLDPLNHVLTNPESSFIDHHSVVICIQHLYHFKPLM